MVKKCVIQYDEDSKPIHLIEVKDFTSTDSIAAFQGICEQNLNEKKEKARVKALEEAEEKQKVQDDIKSLQDEISGLKSVICHILGLSQLTDEEISSILNGSIIEEPESPLEEEPVVEEPNQEEPTDELVEEGEQENEEQEEQSI